MMLMCDAGLEGLDAGTSTPGFGSVGLLACAGHGSVLC